ncbi:hypothetical protein ACF08O_31400 [Streptomyces paradoxus]|uniref:hypothetical protein n=1 Tax=Streptomyces paradoxus TaxID=66375 RepID=UPI0036F4F5A3
MAAIGSLVFTAVATYYGAEVAQQQLEEAQEDNDRETRDQAIHVTFWAEDVYYGVLARGSAKALHLVNRSPDAVSEIQVTIVATHKDKKRLLRLVDTNLPPCAEVVFKADAMMSVLRGDGMARVKDMPWRVESLTFTDRAGRQWVRGTTYLTEAKELKDRRLPWGPDSGIVVPAGGGGKVKALGSCESKA